MNFSARVRRIKGRSVEALELSLFSMFIYVDRFILRFRSSE